MNALHVEVSGSGPDLALVHGWGMHLGIWDAVRERLAARRRVHAVDLPGYGESPSCTPYTLEHLAALLAQALPEPVDVLGWSLGGQVAMRWALQAPQQVRRLVLMATSACFAVRPDWPWGVDAATLQEFAGSLDRDYAGTLRRFVALQAMGEERAKAVLQQLRGRLFSRGRPEPAALRGGLDILLGTDLRPLVARIAQPALVLHGERDAVAKREAGQWLARHLPRAQLRLIAGCGHAPQLSHAAQTLAAVEGFLDG